MHLSASDGFVNMADTTGPLASGGRGRRLYMFSFRDVTGLDATTDPTMMEESFLGAEFPAPTIELDEGDEFYLHLSNVGMQIRPDLFDPHTVHYHGFPEASSVFDGVPDASVSINMMATLTYYYNIAEPGTYMYHCHVEATEHMQMGMLGNLYVRPAQNRAGCASALCPIAQLGGNPDPAAPTGYVYNDNDGTTAYDVEVPIQIGSFDPDFHQASEDVQPLPFALMLDKYPMINGRGYPETINPAALVNTADTPRSAQRVSSVIEATQGDRILLRLSNLNVTNYYTLRSLGIPMEIVGVDARLHRGPGGEDLYYMTDSVTIGGGEARDVILHTADTAPGTYFLYTTNLNFLANDQEQLGGMMTEIVINPVTP
jgi:FtsP/CotA-like multicopper oxidase with cupredoxin domain